MVCSVVAGCRHAVLFKIHPTCHQRPSFQPQGRLHGLSCSCSVRQPQSMAAIPTFTGDGGPILSLTGKQCTEYALFLGDNSDGRNASWLFQL